MVNNGIPAGGLHRNNIGYIGSVQESLAEKTIHNIELRQMAARARQDADASYADGKEDGYAEGWSAAVEIGNEQMRGQLAYTRQYLEEKERLQVALTKQAEIIDTLESRVKALEEENHALRKANGQLRASNSGLGDLIASLRSANTHLQQQVNDLDAQYKERSQQYAEQLWQYNRTMVFVSAVGGVLEELTRDDTPEAQRARDLFTERYAQEVQKGLERGTIRMAPDVDPVFNRFLPKTRRFISDLLAASDEELAARAAEEKEDSGLSI